VAIFGLYVVVPEEVLDEEPEVPLLLLLLL
jgi:hypothetical protein